MQIILFAIRRKNNTLTSKGEDRQAEVQLVMMRAGHKGLFIEGHTVNIQEACRAAALGCWLSIN